MGIAAEERLLTLEDSYSADEVALSNAIGGFVPVRGRGGYLTTRLAKAVELAFARGGGTDPEVD